MHGVDDYAAAISAVTYGPGTNATPRTFEDNDPFTLSNTNPIDSVSAYGRQLQMDSYANQFRDFNQKQEDLINQARDLMSRSNPYNASSTQGTNLMRGLASFNDKTTDQDDLSQLTSENFPRNPNHTSQKGESMPTSHMRHHRFRSNPLSPSESTGT